MAPMPRMLSVLIVGVLHVFPAHCGISPSVPLGGAPATHPVETHPVDVLGAEVEQQVLQFLNFLRNHWETNQETIRAATPGTLRRDNVDKLVYSKELGGHAILEGYQFQGSKLVRGQCAFLQRPVHSTNEFIDYYGRIKTAIAAIYGMPHVDKTVWVDDLYRPLPEYWGVAVMIGHLEYNATWRTAEGTISIELTGDRHSRLTIDYRSQHFMEQEEAHRDEPLLTSPTSTASALF